MSKQSRTPRPPNRARRSEKYTHLSDVVKIAGNKRKNCVKAVAFSKMRKIKEISLQLDFTQ
ncbi:hypothetical protein OBV_21040 [Oscillibacter valericigenes Sjm18-20]|nr:hypothetical protein OBV_21040 [Oscillibacter valericigenes Sjm18-20]